MEEWVQQMRVQEAHKISTTHDQEYSRREEMQRRVKNERQSSCFKQWKRKQGQLEEKERVLEELERRDQIRMREREAAEKRVEASI